MHRGIQCHRFVLPSLAHYADAVSGTYRLQFPDGIPVDGAPEPFPPETLGIAADDDRPYPGLEESVHEKVLILPPEGGEHLKTQIVADKVHPVPLVIGPDCPRHDTVHVEALQCPPEALHVALFGAGAGGGHQFLPHGLRHHRDHGEVRRMEDP